VEALRQKDVKNLLHAVSKVYSGMDRETLPDRTISAVGTVLNCDFICFDSFGSDDNYLDTQWHNDPTLLTPKMAETFGRTFNADPFKHPNTMILSDPSLGAIKFSDCVGRADFRKTDLYNEFFRPSEIEDNMSIAFPLGDGLTITCSAARKLADFDERDRLVLTLLAPHLKNAIRNSIEFKKMQEQEQRLERLFNQVSRAVICVGADGSVLKKTTLASILLSKYFGKDVMTNQSLPEPLRTGLRAVSSDVFGTFAAPRPFYIDLAVSRLWIEPVLDPASGEITLLMREEESVSRDRFASIGLTQRESEVLYWISEGKTDEAIGILCGISTRTVHKHIEHIFQKLNVETRTAAVRVAMDTIAANGNGQIVH